VIRAASANAVALLVTFSRGADSNNDRFSNIEFVLPSAVPLPYFFGYCGPSSSNATGAAEYVTSSTHWCDTAHRRPLLTAIRK
jgi:hypothetical protein